MVVYMAFLSAVLGWGISQGGGMAGTVRAAAGRTTSRSAPDAVVRAVYTIAVTFGYVFPLLVGALAVASEFRHQTITPTLLAEPRRTRAACPRSSSPPASLGLVYGVVGTLAAVGAGAAVLTLLGQPTFLDEASTWRTIALSALALGAVGGRRRRVRLGADQPGRGDRGGPRVHAVRRAGPAVRAGADQLGAGVAAYLPGAAGEAVSGGSFYSETGVGSLLEWWQGALVLLAYGVGLAAIGRVTTFRRDIT